MVVIKSAKSFAGRSAARRWAGFCAKHFTCACPRVTPRVDIFRPKGTIIFCYRGGPNTFVNLLKESRPSSCSGGNRKSRGCAPVCYLCPVSTLIFSLWSVSTIPVVPCGGGGLLADYASAAFQGRNVRFGTVWLLMLTRTNILSLVQMKVENKYFVAETFLSPCSWFLQSSFKHWANAFAWGPMMEGPLS